LNRSIDIRNNHVELLKILEQYIFSKLICEILLQILPAQHN
jgi:hypothetical protein